MTEFTHRLRQLDHQVEELRAALAALQERLAAQHPPVPQGGPATRIRADSGHEWLRAYT
jgi:hypothetical protein